MIGSSMRGRMTIAFALALTTLMALCCTGLAWYARRAEEQNAATVLRMAAQTVRDESLEADAVGDPASFVRVETAELRRAGFLVRSSPSTDKITAAELVTPHFARMRVGATMLTIELPWNKIDERLRSQAITLAALALFAIVAGTIGAWFLVGKTLSPIAALSSEADSARVEGLYVQLRPPSTDAEIQGLVATLNRLLERLSGAAAEQSRFYASASHELRTPLHTLAGHLEVALSRPRSAEEYHATLVEAHRQSDRLVALVRDLLLLTRLNTGPTTLVKETVCLAELCERTIDEVSDRIADRRLSVATDFAIEGIICAAPNHAEMVVRNLIENAVNYATQGGAIEISLKPRDHGIQLQIENDCAEIPADNAQQLLEPFYRPDSNRSSETGGNGLGLAICNAIAQRNGWSLQLIAANSRFRVTVVMDGVDGVPETA